MVQKKIMKLDTCRNPLIRPNGHLLPHGEGKCSTPIKIPRPIWERGDQQRWWVRATIELAWLLIFLDWELLSSDQAITNPYMKNSTTPLVPTFFSFLPVFGTTCGDLVMALHDPTLI